MFNYRCGLLVFTIDSYDRSLLLILTIEFYYRFFLSMFKTDIYYRCLISMHVYRRLLSLLAFDDYYR